MHIDGPSLPPRVEAAHASLLPSALPPRENKASGCRVSLRGLGAEVICKPTCCVQETRSRPQRVPGLEEP